MIGDTAAATPTTQAACSGGIHIAAGASDAARHREGLDEQQLAEYSAGLQEITRTRDVTRIDTARLTTDEVVAELRRLSG
jgi:hypothetical protein